MCSRSYKFSVEAVLNFFQNSWADDLDLGHMSLYWDSHPVCIIKYMMRISCVGMLNTVVERFYCEILLDIHDDLRDIEATH